MKWNVTIREVPDTLERMRLNEFVVSSQTGHLYQYPLLDRYQTGPRVRTLCGWADRDGELGASAFVRLSRVRGVGPLFARIDRGPVYQNLEAVGPLLETVAERVKNEGAASLRVNPSVRLEQSADLSRVLTGLGYGPVQDGDYDVTLLVDIDKSPDALLASFAKGTRYAIRQALKAGVRCDRVAAASEIEALESVYAEMVKRKGATPRPKGLFARILSFLHEDPRRGFVLVSRYEDRIVGGIVVTRYGDRALYTFGASLDTDDGLAKTHVLHYQAMVEARTLHCVGYDLGGFSAGTGTEGSRTAAQSINFFKTRFTKNTLVFLPCHELVLRPLLHGIVGAVRRSTIGSGRAGGTQ